MTGKDFVFLANIIKQTKPTNPDNGMLLQWEATKLSIAAEFSLKYPNFKKDRWLDYIAGKCGPKGGKVK